jgi:hypothetical protein
VEKSSNERREISPIFFNKGKATITSHVAHSPNKDWAARGSRHRASKNSDTIGAMKRRDLLQSLPVAALLPASAWASLQ